jgi:hypothetical protein
MRRVIEKYRTMMVFLNPPTYNGLGSKVLDLLPECRK